MNKKKFAVYGNCQAGPIAKLLLNNEAFKQQFELVNFPNPVYMMSNKDWPEILQVLEDIDLLIFQQVGDAFGHLLSSEHLAANVKPGAIKVSYPSIYFNGYFVEVDYLRGLPGTVNQFSEYHDMNVALNYLNSDTPQQAIEKSLAQIQDPDFYSPRDVLSRVQLSIDELKSREADLDTHVATFVEEHWQTGQLFFSVNHPARQIMLEICYQILKLLNISNEHIPGSFEHLGETKLPIYQSIKKQMLTTDFPELKMKGKQIDMRTYITGLIDTYVDHDSTLLVTEVTRLRMLKHLEMQ
jgi:hypothetical protein